MAESILLKWGTLKGCDLETDKSRAAAQKFINLGMSMSAVCQEMTDAHKAALCELIDAVDGTITNDWSGADMTKKQAMDYVMNYGKK